MRCASFAPQWSLSYQDVPSSLSSGVMPPAGPGGDFLVEGAILPPQGWLLLRSNSRALGSVPARPREVTVGKIFNRRNAVIGFVVLKLRKREAKKKVAAAVPDAQTAGIAAGALAALAGLAGGLVFWRKRRAATE